MVQVRNDQLPRLLESELVQHMQEHHGINPSRNTYKNRLSLTEKPPPVDGFLDLVRKIEHADNGMSWEARGQEPGKMRMFALWILDLNMLASAGERYLHIAVRRPGCRNTTRRSDQRVPPDQCQYVGDSGRRTGP